MPAAFLRVLLGPAGSGKSAALFEGLLSHIQQGESAVLLTPEQSSYEAEKALCQKSGGLVGVQVLSISRFCERVLSEQGGSLPYLSATGRQLVIKKAALRCKDRLLLFERSCQKKGFAADMDKLISKCKQCNVTPEALRGAAGKLPEGSLLQSKLLDIALIYEESQSFLQERYLTESDLWNRAKGYFPGSPLCRSHIYIDGMDLISPQLLSLLQGLLPYCLSMSVALRGQEDKDMGELFEPDSKTFLSLGVLAASLGVPFHHSYLKETKAQRQAPLLHLQRQLFSTEPEAYTEEAEQLTLCGCIDRETEADFVADSVLSLLRQGKRYRDIAVLLCDKESCLSPLLRALDSRHIPYFYDAGRPLEGHGGVDMLLSALRYCDRGDMDGVLHMIKSGFCGVSLEEGEIFENYILRYGLFGSSLKKPFAFGEVPPEAEAVRERIAEPLFALKEQMGSTGTGQQRVLALYRFMESMELRSLLQQQAEQLLSEGHGDESQLCAQVWNVLMGLLDQLYNIMGEETLSHREFVALMEEGIAGSPLGALPGLSDRLLIGDLVRTRSEYVSCLFLMGCNEGFLPQTHPDDGLIDDNELKLLESMELKLWQNTESLSAFERLELYTALGKAEDRLYFSYAYSVGAQELSPSPLLHQIEQLLPKCSKRELLQGDFPLYEQGGFDRLLSLLEGFFKDGYAEEQLPGLYGYFSEKDGYKQALEGYISAYGQEKPTLGLGRTLAESLYGRRLKLSASRLEQYNRCPFAHYANYGLKARERKESKEEPVDIGNLIHGALDGFLQLCAKKGLALRSLSYEEADSLLEELLPGLLETHNDGIYVRDELLYAGLFLQVELIKRSIHSLLEQTRRGSFEPLPGEHSFGMGEGQDSSLPLQTHNGERAFLYGRIDRVDVDAGRRLYRIIDYKTGNRELEYGKLLEGVSLQLPLYLAAMKRELGQMAGMYYMPLNRPPLKEGDTEQQPLKGLTCSDEETVLATEKELDTRSHIIQGLRRSAQGAAGPVCSREQLEKITRLALRKAASTADKILSGEASPAPFKESCDYCPYRSVCRFDESLPGCHYKALNKVKLEELLELLEEK